MCITDVNTIISGSSGTLSLPVSALDLAATPGVRAFALRRGATGARLEPGARRRVVVKVRYLECV